MESAQYPTNHGGPKGDYFIFRFDEEVNIGNLNINRLIGMHRLDTENPNTIGAPIYAKGGELLEYRL
jgi:hypothetical protein